MPEAILTSSVGGPDLTTLQCDLSRDLEKQGYHVVVTQRPELHDGVVLTVMGCPARLKCPFELELVKERGVDDEGGEWWQLARVSARHSHPPHFMSDQEGTQEEVLLAVIETSEVSSPVPMSPTMADAIDALRAFSRSVLGDLPELGSTPASLPSAAMEYVDESSSPSAGAEVCLARCALPLKEEALVISLSSPSADGVSSLESESEEDDDADRTLAARPQSSPARMELDGRLSSPAAVISVRAGDQPAAVPSIQFSAAPTPNSHSPAHLGIETNPPTPSWSPLPSAGPSSSAATPSGLAVPTPDNDGTTVPALAATDITMEVDRPLDVGELFASFNSIVPAPVGLAAPLLPVNLSTSSLATPFGTPPIPAQATFASAWEPQPDSLHTSPYTSPFHSTASSVTNSPYHFPYLYASSTSLTNTNSASTSSFSLSPALPFADLRLERSNSLCSTASGSSADPFPTPPPPPSLALSQVTWFAFLFALDPELAAHAEVLSLPELGVTPASFFRQRRELRTLFLCKLAGRMQEWPRMCLQDAIERDGEKVWAGMQAQAMAQSAIGKGWAGASGAGVGGEGEGFMLAF